jgi:hypothetical protein
MPVLAALTRLLIGWTLFEVERGFPRRDRFFLLSGLRRLIVSHPGFSRPFALHLGALESPFDHFMPG